MTIWIIEKNLMKGYCLKKDFDSHLNMEDITDVDYVQAKKVCKDLEIKNLGEYHDLYVQSDMLLFMYLRTFKKFVLKYINSTLLVFLLHQD